MKKNILTDNGGATNHPENLFDSVNENVVIQKSKKALNFRVKNTATKGSGTVVEMDPPIVKISNQGENVIYPVLRGVGARAHTLQPGEYTDFKLEFNCISLDTEAETVELVFRPSFHSQYVFKVTKECEGLTALGLVKKNFQDSLMFDFFAFLLVSTIVLAILSVLFRLYANYREQKGDDSIRNFFQNFSKKVKSGFDFEEDTQLEMDDIEETHMAADYEFDPDAVLKTNSQKIKSDEEDFNEEVKVNFSREENFDSHELEDIHKEDNEVQNSGDYGTV